MSFKENYGVFTKQTIREHAVMVAVGVSLAHVIYIFAVARVGGIEALTENSVSAMHVRRNGMIAISMFSSVYFGLASIRALGGDLLNYFYIIAALLITPYSVALMHGSIPADMYTEGIHKASYLLDVLPMVVFPGIVTPTIVFILWPWSFKWRETDATYDEWVEENLPY